MVGCLQDRATGGAPICESGTSLYANFRKLKGTGLVSKTRGRLSRTFVVLHGILLEDYEEGNRAIALSDQDLIVYPNSNATDYNITCFSSACFTKICAPVCRRLQYDYRGNRSKETRWCGHRNSKGVNLNAATEYSQQSCAKSLSMRVRFIDVVSSC